MADQRGFPVLWVAILAAVVGACIAGIFLQLGTDRFLQTAHDRPREKPRARTPSPHEDGLPAYGEFVEVEELPEAIDKVAPEYPDAAQWAEVEGTVIVQALIGRDGLVKETKVVQPIPGLDEAAVAAVAQWKFKPARSKGKPIAVWVAVPVKFTLR